jgi:pyruvate dehydrogenase E1 component beta subunit
MYGKSFPVNDEIMSSEYSIPLGKSKIERPGKDVTIVTFSRMVGVSLEAAKELEKEGVDCEVINLRTLRPLDRASIINSVKKTNRIVSVEEGWPQCGIGSEVAAILMESRININLADAFDYLDAPLERITGVDVPMPYAKNLEAAAIPQIENIVHAVRRTLHRNKN